MISVQRNGVPQFTADAVLVANNTYNFLDNTPPPPPAGRLNTASVTWQTHNPFSQITDLTKYKNVAGVISRGQVPIDWPFVSGAQFKWSMPAHMYAAFELNVPPLGTPMTAHYFGSASYSGSVPLRISLSSTPGDFNPATALRVVENVTTENAARIWFRNGAGTNFYVGLNPGGTYYVNVQPMDGTVSQPVALATQ